MPMHCRASVRKVVRDCHGNHITVICLDQRAGGLAVDADCVGSRDSIRSYGAAA